MRKALVVFTMVLALGACDSNSTGPSPVQDTIEVTAAQSFYDGGWGEKRLATVHMEDAGRITMAAVWYDGSAVEATVFNVRPGVFLLTKRSLTGFSGLAPVSWCVEQTLGTDSPLCLEW